MDSKKYIEKIILEEYYSLLFDRVLLPEQQTYRYSKIEVPPDELEKRQKAADAQKSKKLKITKYVNGKTDVDDTTKYSPTDDVDQAMREVPKNIVKKLNPLKIVSNNNLKPGIPGFAKGGPFTDKGEIPGDYFNTKSSLIQYLSPLQDIIKINSAKRDTIRAASDNISDHWEGNHAAYGIDIGLQKGDIKVEGNKIQNEIGDEIFKAIMNSLGMDWKQNGGNGGVFNKRKGGYRIQVIWRDDMHYDHIHIGLKNVRAYHSTAVTAGREENLRKSKG